MPQTSPAPNDVTKFCYQSVALIPLVPLVVDQDDLHAPDLIAAFPLPAEPGFEGFDRSALTFM